MNTLIAVIALGSIAGAAFFMDDRHAPSSVEPKIEMLEVQDERVLKLSELSAREISNDLEQKLLEERLEDYLITEQIQAEQGQPMPGRQRVKKLIIERKIDRLELERKELHEDRQDVLQEN